MLVENKSKLGKKSTIASFPDETLSIFFISLLGILLLLIGFLNPESRESYVLFKVSTKLFQFHKWDDTLLTER